MRFAVPVALLSVALCALCFLPALPLFGAEPGVVDDINVEFWCARNCFRANGRFWVFYQKAYDSGCALFCKSSTDGVNWGEPIFVTEAYVYYSVASPFSVWFDGTYAHISVLDPSGEKVIYVKALPRRDGSLEILEMENLEPTYRPRDFTSIITDTYGNPWIFVFTYNESNDRTYYTIFKKVSGEWVEDNPSSSRYPQGADLVPLSDGKVCLLVMTWNIWYNWTEWRALVWNGTNWSNEYIGNDLSCPPYSAVSVGDTVYVVGYDGSNNIFVRKRIAPRSWTYFSYPLGTEVWPVISVDNFGRLYIFFACYPEDAQWGIYYMMSEDGWTWTEPTLLENEIVYYYSIWSTYSATDGYIGLTYLVLEGGAIKLKFLAFEVPPPPEVPPQRGPSPVTVMTYSTFYSLDVRMGNRFVLGENLVLDASVTHVSGPMTTVTLRVSVYGENGQVAKWETSKFVSSENFRVEIPTDSLSPGTYTVLAELLWNGMRLQSTRGFELVPPEEVERVDWTSRAVFGTFLVSAGIALILLRRGEQ